MGRRLKPEAVTPQEIADTELKLPRDWEELSGSEKKQIAYTVLQKWVEDKMLDAAK